MACVHTNIYIYTLSKGENVMIYPRLGRKQQVLRTNVKKCKYKDLKNRKINAKLLIQKRGFFFFPYKVQYLKSLLHIFRSSFVHIKRN